LALPASFSLLQSIALCEDSPAERCNFAIRSAHGLARVSFALLLSIATAILFSLIPALQSSKPNFVPH